MPAPASSVVALLLVCSRPSLGSGIRAKTGFSNGTCLLQMKHDQIKGSYSLGSIPSESGPQGIAMQKHSPHVNPQPVEWMTQLLGSIRTDLFHVNVAGQPSWLNVPDFVEMPEKPPGERDLYFRPVSVTLFSCMWLTMQCILLHTIFAIARSNDELSAKSEPSFITHVLETAARAVPLCPAMSLLFLANRIYMLESTNQLGEVESWVKLSIVAATFGMTLQLCTVFVLAMTAGKSTISFAELAGDAQDAHPHVLRYNFHSIRMQTVTLAMHTMSMLCIYGGMDGVVLAMAFSGRGVDPESAAVCCTAALVSLFFAVQFALWVTNTGILKGRMDRYEARLRAAAVRADTVVQKAPMFAVLVLSTRLRQIQENTLGGTPHPLLVACFAMVTIIVFLEIALCPFTSGVLDHDGEGPREGPGLVTRCCNYLHCFLSMLGLASASVIANSIIRPWGTAKPLPTSPTVHSVLLLCLWFFIVHLLLTLYALARNLLRLTSSRAEDALLAARNSAGFCPLLCTLILGCRMRALQISHNRGMPQWWEQDFVYLCVGSVAMELICSLTTPFFYKELGVDVDGNPTYDVQSVASAYVVTLVRYVSLLGLHGGVLGVCMAVFTLTPESAMAERPDTMASWKAIARALLWTLGSIMMASLLSSAKVVGMVVKFAIESVDELLLNAEVTVETAVLSICRGQVIMKGLTVKNPVGSSFASDYLLEVGIASVKLNLCGIIRSLGKNIEIHDLVLNGVKLNYELGANGAPSNVGTFLEFLEGAVETEAKDTEAKEQKLQPASPNSAEQKLILVLRRILVKNVSARVLHPTLGPLPGVDLGDMKWEDFSKLSAGRRVGDIVVFVVRTVLRTAASNKDIVKSLLHQSTSRMLSSMSERLKSLPCPCSPSPRRSGKPAQEATPHDM